MIHFSSNSPPPEMQKFELRLPPSLSNSLPCPGLHEITGDSVFVYTALLDMAISENTLADPFEQQRVLSIVLIYPMRDRRGLLIPFTTK